ncbi:MAG: hypothetical protein H6672_03325 [Anaerolineaceae bacterium]|nr:hypothetical protein [Anaerolineaceae bacterium]
MKFTFGHRGWMLFALLALVIAFFIVRLSAAPGYTDSYYHFNAAARLVSGEGLTDPYLWTYIAAPDSLPAPSHQYWMPFTSLVAAFGMNLANAPGDYAAAQWPFVLLLAGTALTGFWLGGKLGGGWRQAWLAGLLTLFSGFFTRFWGQTDTFAPYALVGSLCLVALGYAVSRFTSQQDNLANTTDVGAHGRAPLPENKRLFTRAGIYFALTGSLAGLAHLTRADGVLLFMVGYTAVLWPVRGERYTAILRRALPGLVIMTLAYLLVMLPWFAHNMAVSATPLPVGGTQAIWFREYNDLFNYPPDSSPATFFADGIAPLFTTRWQAFTNNLSHFIVVEGLVVMTPLMLVGLWRRRRDGFLRGFWLYVLGVHLAMTLVFPFPGYRGGLLHSTAALIPWWAALGVVGLDDVVEWVARRRRQWRAGTAKVIFSAALLAVALFLSLSTGLANRFGSGTPRLYDELRAILPENARVMVNDPAALYYFTGLGGVVLPNESPDVIPDIAQRYGVGYLLLQGVTADGRASDGVPPPLWPVLAGDTPFLTPIPLDIPGVRLYAITVE